MCRAYIGIVSFMVVIKVIRSLNNRLPKCPHRFGAWDRTLVLIVALFLEALLTVAASSFWKEALSSACYIDIKWLKYS
jgi:hypothetical protein